MFKQNMKRLMSMILFVSITLSLFSNVVVLGAAGNPVIVEVTPNPVSSDETVELIGENLVGGSIGIYRLPDTDFSQMNSLMGQIKDESNITQTPTQFISILNNTSDNGIAGVVPKEMSHGEYILWAKNSNGLSNPLLANRTEAFYAYPNEINLVKSKEVTIIGKNLTYKNGDSLSDGHAYLRNSSDNSYLEVPLKAVNQYELVFDLPDSVTAGAFDEVWINNGHGGDYGWSKVNLVIKNQVIPSTVYDVTDPTYGAIANDGKDDTDAIQAAINAATAAGGGIVKLPAGTFHLDNELPSPVESLTKLKVSNPFGGAAVYAVGREFDKVFDCNTTTYYDYKGSATDIGSVGFDLGEGNAQTVSVIRYWPRSGTGNPAKMIGGKFQGSNDGVNYEDLYTVTVAPPESGAAVRVIAGQENKAFRYFRYYSTAANPTCNLSDMEFFTGTIDASVNLPAPTKPEASNQKLTIKANVLLQGAGKDQTTIKYRSAAILSGKDDGTGPEMVNMNGSNTGLENIRLEGSESVDRGLVIGTNINDITIKNVDIYNYFPGIGKKSMFGGIMSDGGDSGNSRVFIDNCIIESGGCFNLSKVYNSKISNNTILSRAYTPATFSCSYQSIYVGNYLDGRDKNGKRIGSRGFNFNLHPKWNTFKPTAMNYIARNDFQYIGNEIVPTNDGEILLFDALVDVDADFTGTGNRILHYGSVNAATSNSVTVKGMSKEVGRLTDEYIVVVEGKGLGQVRKITGNTADIITVDKAWTIQPDATSRVSISRFFYKNIVANNTASNNKGNDMRMYGQCIGNIFDGNISTVGDGTSPTKASGGTAINAFDRNLTTFHPTYYNIIKNSTGTRQEISFGTNLKLSSPRSVSSLGNVISKNTATSNNITSGGASLFSTPKTSMLYNIIENNAMTNTLKIDSPIIGHTIIRNNQSSAAKKYTNYGTNSLFIENGVDVGPIAPPDPTPIPQLPTPDPKPIPEGNKITFQYGINNYYGSTDASLRSDTSGQKNNNGVWGEFECAMYNGAIVDTKYALLRFDTSLIPTDRQITGATISLYHSTTRNSSETFKTIDIHNVTSPWEEGNGGTVNIDGTAVTGTTTGVSYATRPTWETGSETALDSVLTSYIAGSWYDFDVTKAAQEWVKNPNTNFGLVLMEDQPINANGTRTFASSQYSIPNLRPKLTLYYKGDEIAPPQETVAPAEVTETAVVNDDKKVWLTWKDPIDADLFKIRIYNEGKFVAEVDKNIQSATITGLTNGTSYNYTIKAVDGCGNASEGILVKAAPKAPNTTFFRGINLNGDAVTINGNQWLSYASAKTNSKPLTVTTPGSTLSVASGTNFPIPYDDNNYDLTHMLNTNIYHNSTSTTKNMTLEQAVDNGDYRIFVWYMEDWQNYNRRFNLDLEDKRVATQIGRENKAEYKRYGPFDATVTDGKLTLKLTSVIKEGTISGLEIYTLDLHAPAEVTGYSSTSGDGSTTLIWTEPSDSDYDHVNITCESVTGAINGPINSFIGSYAKGTQSAVVGGLTVGATYNFRIQTVDSSGNLSSGVLVQGTALQDSTAPSEVSIPSGAVTVSDGKMTIKWEDPDELDFAKVKLSGVNGTSLATVTGSVYDYVYANKGAETYTFTGLTNGTLYSLKLQTMDLSGNLSQGVIVTGTPIDNIPPHEVKNLSITAMNDQVTFVWNDPTDSDFSQVLIQGEGLTVIEDVYKGKGFQSATITGLPIGEISKFWVKTLDANGNRSAGTFGKVGTPSLTDIKVGGISVNSFNGKLLTYAVPVAYGTVLVPSVTGTTANGNTISVTQASAIPGTAQIRVTSADGRASVIYTIQLFVAVGNSNTYLQELRYDGKLVEGFNKNIREYTVILPYGSTEVPYVTALKEDASALEPHVIQASSLPGVAKIEVTAQNGVVEAYTLHFEVGQLSGNSIQIGTIQVTNINGDPLAKLEGAGDIVCSVAITNQTANLVSYAPIAVLYNAAGDIKQLIAIDNQKLASGATESFIARFSGISASESGNYIKILVWDSWNGMKSLSNAVTFPSRNN